MRHLTKPNFNVKTIVEDCAASIQSAEKRKRFNDSSSYIQSKSDEYDSSAQLGEWESVSRETKVNGMIETKEMVSLYNDKFVKHSPEREQYYDKIMGLAINGKCPICSIGQVSTLDHYLAKTIYPTYAVTPINLVPVCRDCNTIKKDAPITANDEAPLHPYFDHIDDLIWLKASVERRESEFGISYYINPDIEVIDSNLYLRLNSHFSLYGLSKAYATQATTEVAENISMWERKYNEWGKEVLQKHLQECLESKELYQRNTWNTALLRAIIENIDIFSSFDNVNDT